MLKCILYKVWIRNLKILRVEKFCVFLNNHKISYITITTHEIFIQETGMIAQEFWPLNF